MTYSPNLLDRPGMLIDTDEAVAEQKVAVISLRGFRGGRVGGGCELTVRGFVWLTKVVQAVHPFSRRSVCRWVGATIPR